MSRRQVKSGAGAASGAASKGSVAKSKQPQPSGLIAVWIEEAQVLLQKLENSAKTLTAEESEATVHALMDRYKQISFKNKVDSKREEYLQTDISEFQKRNTEAINEVNALREEFHGRDAKLDKLDKLSKHLSSRLRSVESKATDDVKEEKESRLKMSYDFSATIKDISQKLDQLGKKREHIVTENNRLKQVLRDCLEEFDRDQEQQRAMDEEPAAGTGRDGAAEAEDKVLHSEVEGIVAAASGESPADRSIEELRQMEMEDDLSRILHLMIKEAALKAHTIRFMEIFDSFQVRLTKSNHLFQVKQAAVEDMTKRIKGLERTNQQMAAHVHECTASTKAIIENVDKVRAEKLKNEKMMEKQRSLIDRFQADILAMEGGADSK